MEIQIVVRWLDRVTDNVRNQVALGQVSDGVATATVCLWYVDRYVCGPGLYDWSIAGTVSFVVVVVPDRLRLIVEDLEAVPGSKVRYTTVDVYTGTVVVDLGSRRKSSTRLLIMYEQEAHCVGAC